MATIEQVKTFKNSADTIFRTGDYTSATILYFKTLFAIEDFSLLKKVGYSPKDHTERFALMRKHFPDAYKQLDMEFNTYRDTYSKTISKETCVRIKTLVENELKSKQIH